MVNWNWKRMAGISLALLALTTCQVASAELTDKQKELMERGRVRKLAESLTMGAKTRVERISSLYLFVRDEIRHFNFKSQRSPSRVLMDGAGRKDDKARLLAELLDKIDEECYLATVDFIKYGEQFTYAFVAVRARKKEAEAMSRATGGDGEFMRFRIRRREGRFIPLVPVAGYHIGKLSTEYFEETEEGSGKWKRWRYPVRFKRYY